MLGREWRVSHSLPSWCHPFRAALKCPIIDTSGKGAVLCAWEITVGMRNALDICFPGEFIDMRHYMTRWIDATNDFIVSNSATPITKAEIEATMQRRLARDRARASSAGMTAGSPQCEQGRKGVVERYAEFRATPPAELHRRIDDFLSIPRVPVINPCL